MQARNLAAIAIIGMTLTGVGTASAQGVEVSTPNGSVSHLLTVRVPSVVRVSMAPDQTGTPTVRVQTNDPAIRAMVARGVRAEELQSLAVQFTGAAHQKGGQSSLGGEAQVTDAVMRYTIVRP